MWNDEKHRLVRRRNACSLESSVLSASPSGAIPRGLASSSDQSRNRETERGKRGGGEETGQRTVTTTKRGKKKRKKNRGKKIQRWGKRETKGNNRGQRYVGGQTKGLKREGTQRERERGREGELRVRNQPRRPGAHNLPIGTLHYSCLQLQAANQPGPPVICLGQIQSQPCGGFELTINFKRVRRPFRQRCTTGHGDRPRCFRGCRTDVAPRELIYC